jgi:5-methylcytosine-specific restriction protein A
MAKGWAKPFYNSKAWRICRQGYIESVGGLCETCLEQGRYTPGYIVHHKELLTPYNIHDPTVTLNWSRLKYECKECHDKNEGHRVGVVQGMLAEGLMFTVDGDIVKVVAKP